MRTVNPGEEKVAWQLFSSRGKGQKDSPFRIEASLRYSGPNISSVRVSSILWGNGQSRDPYPLRLDLTAGLGTVVAKVREDINTFVAYVPQEKTAYISSKNNKSLISFGVPIPLSLGELSLLLTEQNGHLFLPQKEPETMPQVVGVTPEGICFDITNARLSGIIELAPNGALLSWKEHKASGWSVHFENNKNNSLELKKVTITHPKGYEAIITIKEFSLLKHSFSSSQLDLLLPAGTVEQSLLENM